MGSGKGQRRGKAAKGSFSSGGCAQKAGQQNVNTSDGEIPPSGDWSDSRPLQNECMHCINSEGTADEREAEELAEAKNQELLLEDEKNNAELLLLHPPESPSSAKSLICWC